MGVYNKLSLISSNLFVPKGQTNNFGKYNYRSCEDILKAVKPLCKDNNCTLYISNDLVNIGDRNYVKATVILVDLETGEQVVSTAHAREEETKKGMDGSQITGASSSYARKYALAGLFGIDNEKDSDATNEGEEKQAKKTQAVSDAQIKTEALKYLNEHNDKAGIEAFCKHYKIKNTDEITVAICKDYLKKVGKIA